MAISKADLLVAAKAIAQEKSTLPLLHETTDYDQAVALALRRFDRDVPNERTVNYTVLAAGFRFVLAGSGAILSGVDAWIDGRSFLRRVTHPYDATSQSNPPIPDDEWRIVRDPAAIVLELLQTTPTSGVLRLEFVTPHTLHATVAASSTIPAGYVEALSVATAFEILMAFARRAVQNTGSGALPNDTVDRRTQSDIARSRAKELLESYFVLVGRSKDPADVAPASAVKDLDVPMSHAFGPLWHLRGMR